MSPSGEASGATGKPAATAPKAEALSDFGRRVEREAHHRQYYGAERQVVIGDGAPRICNTVYEMFPAAIEVVEISHAWEKSGQLFRRRLHDRVFGKFNQVHLL